MTRLKDRTIESQRVSMNDVFMTVTRFDDPRYPPAWILTDESGPSVHVIDYGRGEPPAKHLPLMRNYPAPRSAEKVSG